MKFFTTCSLWMVLLLAATSGQAQVTLKQIDDATADLSCDKSTQCKAIGIGKRQCGGPAYFKTYSSKNVDEAKLESLVSQYNNSITFPPDSAGICVFATMPVSACMVGSCEATADMVVASPSNSNTLVVNLPAVVYMKNMNSVKDANGVYHADIEGKEVYQVRLESFIDDRDGQMKFRIQQLIKQP